MTTKSYESSLKPPRLKTKSIAIKEIQDYEIEVPTNFRRNENDNRIF